MPQKRTWSAPPTRREFTLVLFSLTIFVLSYNLEASLGLVGVHPQRLSSSYLSAVGLGTKDPGFDADGRRPPQWRDKLEDLIVGDWDWREGEVSGVPRGRPTTSGSGRYGMIYDFGTNRRVGRASQHLEDRGVSLSAGVTVKDQFIKWGKEIPQTKFVAHTPGFTILDNVIVANGTLFIVANDWTKIPKLGDIASSSLDPSKQPRTQDWHTLTTRDASSWFGPYAAKIHGTSWLALDKADAQDPYNLFSLFRTHAALSSPSTSSSLLKTAHGQHGSSSSSLPASAIPAPLRIIFPHIPTFSTPHIPPGPGEDDKTHPPPRERAHVGLNPLTPKAILPATGMWFEEDWADLAEMHVPFLLERVVVADRGAALRGRGEAQDGAPAWAAPFERLQAPKGWWAPARAALLRYLRIPDDATAQASGGFWGRKDAKKAEVTYVSMLGEPEGAGARLSAEDEQRLVDGLRRMERDGLLGAVHVVKGNGSVPALGWEERRRAEALEWTERMGAFARSSIVLGPYGHQLADSIFMRSPIAQETPDGDTHTAKDEAPRPTPPLLMEFFPPGIFVRDQQYAMQALGIDYMAWWDERKFSVDNLPAVISQSSSPRSDRTVPLDVDAVLRTIREEAPRRTA